MEARGENLDYVHSVDQYHRSSETPNRIKRSNRYDIKENLLCIINFLSLLYLKITKLFNFQFVCAFWIIMKTLEDPSGRNTK